MNSEKQLPNFEAVKAAVSAIKRKYKFKEFTKDVYRRICEGENVTPVEIALSGSGYYVRSPRKNWYIYINSRLPEWEFLETAGHELGHLWMHTAKLIICKFKPNAAELEAMQIEADLFGELLIGKSLLDAETIEDVLRAEVIQ